MFRTLGLAALLLAFHPPEPQVGCWCDKVRVTNGWCQQCKLGYIAGVHIKSELFVEALDTHGHPVDPQGCECKECSKAAAVNGICTGCGWRYANQKMYASPLTYYLALGQIVDLSSLHCTECRKLAKSTGWCDSCEMGWVAHFSYCDMATFEHAAREYRLLLRAVELIERCEYCAVACYSGSTCLRCKTSFEDTRPTGSETQPTPAPVKP